MEERKPAKTPNADQLRAAIDSGKTGDKVAFPDPAAAPLGTDAEAGGAPPASDELNQAFTAELGMAEQPEPAREGRALPMVIGFMGLVAVAAVITYLILAA